MSVGDLLEREDDRPAYVRFETRAVTDKEATLKEGHHVSKDEDYVLVTPPYSKDCVEKKVETWFAQKEIDVKQGRVPERHLQMWKQQYEAYKNGQEAPIDGTSVKEWNILSPAQCANLISAGCRTIEDLAQANDEALRRVGMGAHDLRNKAVAYLQSAKDTSPLVNQVSSLQKENEVLKGSLDSLQEQVTLLMRQLDTKENQAIASQVDPTEFETGITAKSILPDNSVFVKANNLADKIVIETPAEQYFAKFGKKPHHRMAESTILAKLQE